MLIFLYFEYFLKVLLWLRFYSFSTLCLHGVSLSILPQTSLKFRHTRTHTHLTLSLSHTHTHTHTCYFSVLYLLTSDERSLLHFLLQNFLRNFFPTKFFHKKVVWWNVEAWCNYDVYTSCHLSATNKQEWLRPDYKQCAWWGFFLSTHYQFRLEFTVYFFKLAQDTVAHYCSVLFPCSPLLVFELVGKQKPTF